MSKLLGSFSFGKRNELQQWTQIALYSDYFGKQV